ncbi:hypothetical protein BH23CHL2_BH23CHL2_16060 [soil metagenome]
MSVVIRPATEHDLPDSYDVQQEASIAKGLQIGNVGGPNDGRVPAKFRHELQHGRFLVAEVGGRIVGFGAVFERGDIAFLATFYVRPDAQIAGLGVGQKLLDDLFDVPAGVRCVVSSHVYRALALYARNGLLPRWPLLMLEGRSTELDLPPIPGVSVEPTDPDDPELISWDADIAGRGVRPVDQRYWLNEYAASPYWIRRNGARIGYGYIQRLFESADAPWHPDTVLLGPIGVRKVSESVGAVVALVDAAQSMAPRILIDMPGAHPALPSVLTAGFRIHYQATFCSSAACPPFDPRRYVPADTITF